MSMSDTEERQQVVLSLSEDSDETQPPSNASTELPSDCEESQQALQGLPYATQLLGPVFETGTGSSFLDLSTQLSQWTLIANKLGINLSSILDNDPPHVSELTYGSVIEIFSFCHSCKIDIKNITQILGKITNTNIANSRHLACQQKLHYLHISAENRCKRWGNKA
ncbi:hypothetical protein MAR_025535 [Mya arenaria]|uniref:Uncharacterized protein n=1 Tax=Mya arenaria TaxID=6604 RepID=A0ABY7END5_MYAAR|nr:hypothetical protein MAR_025535 [Mya arenaria]